MLKKPNFLCYGGLQLLNPLAPPSPPCVPRSKYLPSSCRYYACAHGPSGRDLSWPSSSSFTPYDLFKQDRGAPYTKSHFYDLVKIYHPDRPCNDHPLHRNLSPEVRLQRYHILVAAHEILSDPAKRAAYDQFGTGWTLHRHDPTPSWSKTESSDYGTIFDNATWEDWERWHNRHQGKQQQMVDHRTFVTFILLLVLFGGAVQASWIGQLSTGYEDRLREMNEESLRFLVGRRETTVKQMASSQASVQHFLIRRDPSGSGLKEEEQPVYQKALHTGDTSISSSEAEDAGDAKDQDKGSKNAEQLDKSS